MNLQLPVFVTDYFNEWMVRVNEKLPFDVHRYSCHIFEVIENLQQLDQAGRSDIKYPLVILLTDVEETVGEKGADAGRWQTANMNIIIANTTINTYKQPQRLEQNFKPVLAPIYRALLESIIEDDNTHVMTIEDLKHKKYDRYFWGREKIFGNDANVLTDYIDAIEIKGLQVKLTTTFC